MHVLGYFVDARSAALLAFLTEQRRERAERVRQIVARLATLGIALDADEILRPGVEDSGKAPGRPWVARALVAGRHVATTRRGVQSLARPRPSGVRAEDAARARPMPSIGFTKRAACRRSRIPVLVKHDEWLHGFAASGMDALEAYHSDHDAWTTRHYLEVARRLGLAVSGGSDYHGDDSHGPKNPGSVSLPPEEFERLVQRASDRTARATASGSGTSS